MKPGKWLRLPAIVTVAGLTVWALPSSAAVVRQVAPNRAVRTAALASALGSGQLDPVAFNAAVNRVTALRAGLF